MPKKPRDKSPYFLLAVDFGYNLLGSILVLGGLGWYIDTRYGTTPWLMIAGGLLGIAVGFNSLFRRLNLLEEKRKVDKKKSSAQDSPPGRQPR